MLSLNIIRDQDFNKDIITTTNILQPSDIYAKLVAFMHDPRFIRIGTIESVRTVELAAAFNNIMRENAAYKSTFPRLMKQFMTEHSNLSIIKKTKNYGTVYEGIGLTSDPIPQEGTTTILQRSRNEKHIIRNRAFLDEIKMSLCQKCNWTDSHYRQMGTLGLIKLIKHGKNIDSDASISVINGRLIEYIYEKNIKLREKARYALLIKVEFEKAIICDTILSEGNGTPVYTNRLNTAEETYNAGEKLQRAINSYTNRIKSLPSVNISSNPNIDELNDLALWLKSNSMHKTRIDMRIKQEAADPEIPQAVNWTLEEGLKYHVTEKYLETEN